MSRSTQSDVGKLRSVLLKHARDAFVSDAQIGTQWQLLNYTAAPDLASAAAEYDAFAALLMELGVEIVWLESHGRDGLDSVYVRDTAVMTDMGLVLANMTKPERESEVKTLSELASEIGVVVYGAIKGEGRLEGGDVAWVGPDVVAVGRGYRTNDEGIAQLEALLGPGIEVIVVPLPHWRGVGDVFHLMSMFSPIDRNLAVVYEPLLPVPFRERLLERGIELVSVPDDEFATMGCNVLAVAPRTCVILDGNPHTRKALEAAGASVHEYRGDHISRRGQGGPTCLTRPLDRAAMWR